MLPTWTRRECVLTSALEECNMHGVDVDLVIVVHPIENQIITTEYSKTARYSTT